MVSTARNAITSVGLHVIRVLLSKASVTESGSECCGSTRSATRGNRESEAEEHHCGGFGHRGGGPVHRHEAVLQGEAAGSGRQQKTVAGEKCAEAEGAGKVDRRHAGCECFELNVGDGSAGRQ